MMVEYTPVQRNGVGYQDERAREVLPIESEHRALLSSDEKPEQPLETDQTSRSSRGVDRWRWIVITVSSLAIILLIVMMNTLKDLPVGSERFEKGRGCNPFKELGYLHTNATDPSDNVWVPYDEGCRPWKIFGSLMSKIKGEIKRDKLKSRNLKSGEDETDELSWMRNRTVVVIGDSVDRYLVSDFCQLLNSTTVPDEAHHLKRYNFSDSPSTPRYFSLGSQSPLIAPAYYYDGKNRSTPPEDWPPERLNDWLKVSPSWSTDHRGWGGPRICYLPTHDFMIVYVASYGLSPRRGGWYFVNDPIFHPPHKLIDRAHHILLPTLSSLATYLDRISTNRPDLVQVCSGYWDLRELSTMDFMQHGEKANKISDYIYEDLSMERLNRWRKTLVETIRGLGELFNDPKVPIVWRTYSRPATRYYHVPFTRIHQLDELAQYTLEGLMKADQKLGPRLRINEWGRRYRGQEYHQRDQLHPNTVPGYEIRLKGDGKNR